MAAALLPPTVIPLDRARIPDMLQNLPRWVAWTAGPKKPDGKFSKVPTDPRTGRNINGNDPQNWRSFDDVCKAYDQGKCSGVGIVLSDEPVGTFGGTLCGAHQYLVALDFDHCAADMAAIKKTRLGLGQPYVEVSPSGDGLRIFALSRTPPKGGNAGGREMYSAGRFMTVTGNSGRGNVIDATEALEKLQAEWFQKAVKPGPTITTVPSKLALALMGTDHPETPEAIERVLAQLAHIPADCSYQVWGRIVWSILSSGWESAGEIARNWSLTAPERYDDKAFDQLVASFNPARGITLGTLDHHAREGGWRPVVAAPDRPPTQHTQSGAAGAKRLLTGQDLKALPQILWRVRGLLPSHGIAAIYGPSGSGKTFLALDLACALASGQPLWFGAKVKAAPVAYVALEGEGGICQRVAAWEKQHGAPVPDSIRFLLGNFTLLNASDSETLASEITQTIGIGAVVFIDTLNQSAPGADENASGDMGTVLANAKLLADAVQGIVVLVHHAGKDASRGMRGHSSLFAAMDAVIEVSSTLSGRTWRVAKSKDGISGVAYGFELMPHCVDQDDEGADVTSCAIRPLLLTTSVTQRKAVGKNQIAGLQALQLLATKFPKGVPMNEGLQALAGVMSGPAGRRKSRALEVLESLTKSGHLYQSDGGIFLHEP